MANFAVATCRASCACFDGYGGDGCQYTYNELIAVVGIRQSSLEFVQSSAYRLDISRDTIARQATLLSKVSLLSFV